MRSALIAAFVLISSIAAGQSNEATSLYTKATELTRTGKCTEAIPLLERSYQLVNSPSSALLLARCLRDVERFEEAYGRYEDALGKADERVAAGELRHSATATTARDEIAALRKKMGSVVVRGLGATQKIEVRGLHVAALSDGTARAHVRAGQSTLKVLESERMVSEHTIDVKAEESIEIVVRREAPIPPPPAAMPPPERTSYVWLAPAGVGVLGFGTLTFFGLRASSANSSLEDCSPNCDSSRRDEADAGKRDQTIANIGLALGIVGIAAAGILFLLNR